MNSGFINPKIKKILEKMFWNDFFIFQIFYYGNIFVYGITISETPKIVKGNFDIFEECRGAGRKV